MAPNFFQKKPQLTSTAAWALVNATTGLHTGYGYVPGLVQSISRAEQYGILAAACWCLRYQVQVFVWCDSSSTVKGVLAILRGDWTAITSSAENHDLWQRLCNILEQIPHGHFQGAWTPSHLDPTECSTSLEEWRATWNDIADASAVVVNTRHLLVWKQG